MSEPELRQLIQVRAGDTFSRSRMQASVKAMSERMGVDGYAFANVNAVPEIDRTKNTVAFTFFVDAGRRVYVRKINISGNPKTRDEVIRRELRQLESAWYDGTRIERSKVRVRRLGYFEEGSVNVETPPVPGTTDQVDLEVSVTEKNTGNLLAGVGYSSSEGVVFNASVSQQNIFGSGNALALSVNTSSLNRTISLTYTEPYWTVDGVSRTLEVYQQEHRPDGTCRLRSTRRRRPGGAVGFGVPVSEIDTINFGFRFEHTNLELFSNSPPIYYQFVQDFGYSTNSYIVSGGWARDTRNDILYPTFGRLQSALVEVGLPIGDLAYYKLQYVNQSFWPVYGDFVLMLRADVGYGDGYSGKPLPFFKAFYAGGVGSVRGYESGSLGPRDIYGNSLGGKRKIVGNAELFYPILKGERSVRISGVLRCRPDLRERLPAGLRELPLLGRRRVSRGTRRSGRSSSATRYRSTRSRPTRSRSSSSRSGPCSRRWTGAAENTLKPIASLIAAGASCSLAAGAAHGADYKIGFVNTERLFREAAPAKRAQQKLEKEFAARDAELQKLRSRCATCRRCSTRTAPTMGEAERRNKERDLANQSRDLQRMQREIREDLNLRRNEELAGVQERANKVIQQIAEAEKFDLIMQDPVVFASQRIDITDKVIKALADK